LNSRPFRTDASFDFEKVARERIAPFLARHGFVIEHDQRVRTGSATSQVIVALDPQGTKRKMRVRLCWRRDGRKPRENLYSAAQLRARLIDDDWEKPVTSVAARGAKEGVDQTLFLQADGDGILFAVVVPNSALPAIWAEQRRVSRELIEKGLMGRIRKNHAENGSSPTIWLQDERTPAAHRVSDVLWSWAGVIDIRSFPSTGAETWDDALDDLPLSPDSVGSDNGVPIERRASGWKRDPKVALSFATARTVSVSGATAARDAHSPGFWTFITSLACGPATDPGPAWPYAQTVIGTRTSLLNETT
jgi:5-methylcytosine-specific restriction protein A